MARLARRDGRPDTLELHDLLVTIEDTNPIAAAKLIMNVLFGTPWTTESGDIEDFCAQHNWKDPVAVGDMFTWVTSWMRWLEDREPLI